MVSKNRFALPTVFLIIILCISLANANSALADDSTPAEPPPATEEQPNLLWRLLKCRSNPLHRNLYKIITAEKTGLFVLVKK
jgi:hypothetical protein